MMNKTLLPKVTGRPLPTVDFNPFQPEPVYYRGRYVCTSLMPLPDARCHPAAKEILDMGETRWMECPWCGDQWKEELPE
jgi:hypothetical protein